MNFINKYIKLGLFFLLTCLNIDNQYASKNHIDLDGMPFINNYSLPEPFGYYNVNSLEKDSNGTVFMAVNDNILCIYNNDYDIISLPGKVLLTASSSKIFVSADQFIGFIQINSLGNPILSAIVNDSLAESFNISTIDNFAYCNQSLYFTSKNILYRLKSNVPEVIDSSKGAYSFFTSNNKLLIHPHGKELLIASNKGLEPYYKAAILGAKSIEWLFSEKDGITMKLENGIIYNIDTLKQIKLNNNFLNIDRNINISSVSIFNDSVYIVVSPQKGIQYYLKSGRLINTIDSEKGLPDSKVKYVYIDIFKNTIAVFDNYISIIRTGFPMSFFGRAKGLSGKINDILVFNGSHFVASTNGLHKLVEDKKTKSIHFEQIKNVHGIGLKIRAIDSIIYYISSKGIYCIENEKADQLVNDPIISEAFLVSDSNKLILSGTDKKIKVFKVNKRKLQKIREFNIDEPITKIIPDNKGYIWFLTGLNKISILREDMVYHGGKLKNISILKAAINSIVVNNNLLYFISKQDIYIFDYNNNLFVKDNIISNLEQGKTLRLFPISTNDTDRQWFTYSDISNNNYGLLLLNNKKGDNRIQFINIPHKLSGIVFVEKNNVWVGSYNGLLHYSINEDIISYSNLNTRIKEIKIGNDSSISLNGSAEIDFSLNNIHFSYSTSQIENDLIQYQYRLINANKQWSDWSNQTIKDYTNLSPGYYTFQLRSRNLNGNISSIVEYQFQIKRPFYLSIPFYILYILIGLIMLFLFFRWRTWVYLKENEKLENIIHERTEELIREKEKSEHLLANMLPKGTADELKLTGKATSQKYTMATVLFSDIQGFTKIAEHLNPDTLIDQLDSFFFQFDSVVERYNIEKIKTIGDAYMCAGGIPKKNITNPVEVVLAALEMQDYMHDLKAKNTDIWDLRIGIHTGSVIAGVVGQKKLSYDIWGDTVNVASRMESSGEPGKVNVSGQTYEHIKEFFVCEYRGKMPVKYKGEIDMYFVKCVRPELSQNMKNIPNKKFQIKLQLLRLFDLEEFMYEKYERELPENLHFHNINHVKETVNYSELLAKANDLTVEENLILITSALLHDIGYIWSYENHEDFSVNFVREILPQFRYTPEQIDQICELINVTRRGQKAQNILEETLLDSIMGYIGRPDFVILSENLYNELYDFGLVHSKDEWVKMQITLLSNHKFNTEAANKLREVPADRQIELLLSTFDKKSF